MKWNRIRQIYFRKILPQEYPATCTSSFCDFSVQSTEAAMQILLMAHYLFSLFWSLCLITANHFLPLQMQWDYKYSSLLITYNYKYPSSSRMFVFVYSSEVLLHSLAVAQYYTSIKIRTLQAQERVASSAAEAAPFVATHSNTDS